MAKNYFNHHDKENIPEWLKFEHQVATLFKLFGYDEVTHDTKIDSGQCDVLVKSKKRNKPNILAECKYHKSNSNKVNIVEVQNFIYKVSNYRNLGKIDQGYLVTNTGFTADARGAVNDLVANFVFLVTYDELLESLLDINNYLEEYINDYDRLGEGQRFIDMKLLDTTILNQTIFDSSPGTIYKNDSCEEQYIIVPQFYINDYKENLSFLNFEKDNNCPSIDPIKYFHTLKEYYLEYTIKEIGNEDKFGVFLMEVANQYGMKYNDDFIDYFQKSLPNNFLNIVNRFPKHAMKMILNTLKKYEEVKISIIKKSDYCKKKIVNDIITKYNNESQIFHKYRKAESSPLISIFSPFIINAYEIVYNKRKPESEHSKINFYFSDLMYKERPKIITSNDLIDNFIAKNNNYLKVKNELKILIESLDSIDLQKLYKFLETLLQKTKEIMAQKGEPEDLLYIPLINIGLSKRKSRASRKELNIIYKSIETFQLIGNLGSKEIEELKEFLKSSEPKEFHKLIELVELIRLKESQELLGNVILSILKHIPLNYFYYYHYFNPIFRVQKKSKVLLPKDIFDDIISSLEKYHKLLPQLILLPEEDALTIFRNFLFNDPAHVLVLIGDYGAGKTTVLRKFMRNLAEDKLSKQNDPSCRIPLLISLKDYNKVPDFNSLIRLFLQEKAEVENLSLRTFKKLNEEGRFILLLDAFDEMLARVTKADRRRCFKEISDLVAEGSKVIITGRPAYFTNYVEFKENLQILCKTASNIELGYKIKYSIKCLQLLDEDQVEHLFKKLTTADDHSTIDIIANKPNLMDIARRPVLTAMISSSTKEILKLKNNELSVRKVYEIYTNKWVQREEDKGDFRLLIHPEQKSTFLRYLAMQMFIDNSLTIHYSELNKFIASYFKLDTIIEIDHFSHDIRTCSFLSRSDDGYYSFIHKSFMEYFVACEYEQMENSPFADKLIDGLTIEIIDLLDFKQIPSNIKDYWTKRKNVEDCIKTISEEKIKSIKNQNFDKAKICRDFEKLLYEFNDNYLKIFTMYSEKVPKFFLYFSKKMKNDQNWNSKDLIEIRNLMKNHLLGLPVDL